MLCTDNYRDFQENPEEQTAHVQNALDTIIQNININDNKIDINKILGTYILLEKSNIVLCSNYWILVVPIHG